MRFGLVGYGAWGRHHARCIRAVAEAELAAICCHGDESAAAAAADHPGVAIYRDFRELVAAPGIDAVDVVAPNHLHAEIGVAAMEAGKDVLLEKPMATTVADCDRLLDAERRSGRLVSVGFELRVSEQWGAIKRLIDEGAVGAPRYANFSLFRHPYRQGSGGWRHAAERVGSWTLEEPVHFFDLLMWYFEAAGDPVAVRASGNALGRDHKQRGMYDNITAALAFPSDTYATMTQSLAGFEHHQVFEIAGERGAIRTWWSGTTVRTFEPAHELKLLRAGASEPEVVPLAKSGEVFELEEQIRRTVAAFRERRPLVSGEEARKRVVVCLEAERSVREGGAEVPLRF